MSFNQLKSLKDPSFSDLNGLRFQVSILELSLCF